ncbi:NTF2-like domain protein [Phlyctema vagabunda]|uniref:NTF2-like domain protein n=1 Tax=Phlyctema vagabunda TaxID=108571 RepID=A0ABR4PF44_9HELO
MSLTIPTSQSERPELIRQLLKANLLSVFDERDDISRKVAIENTYAEDIIWYEPERLNQGQDTLDRRAAELLEESPGFRFQPDGEMVVTQNLGVLHWKFGPVSDPGLLKGVDVILVVGGKIKALWTALTKVPGQ